MPNDKDHRILLDTGNERSYLQCANIGLWVFLFEIHKNARMCCLLPRTLCSQTDLPRDSGTGLRTMERR